MSELTISEITLVNKKKRVYKKILLGFLIVFLLFISLIGYAIYWAFYDMDRLTTGEFLTEETSPDGKYTVKAYVTNGGATVAYTVRGELVFNEKEHKSKNIYWNYREDTAHIKWISNDEVEINGHKLKVPNEKFDFRHE
ncbi:DUF5412 domain-containing protein [Ureibacillus chungkukjangi]|nr:DUF5412 domain-containing protein [Ureibacillus chungkukjangi]MCM3387136.1 DUF5412 domain-containing protein [Ureibacillus chungkukjangi]